MLVVSETTSNRKKISTLGIAQGLKATPKLAQALYVVHKALTPPQKSDIQVIIVTLSLSLSLSLSPFYTLSSHTSLTLQLVIFIRLLHSLTTLKSHLLFCPFPRSVPPYTSHSHFALIDPEITLLSAHCVAPIVILYNNLSNMIPSSSHPLIYVNIHPFHHCSNKL